MSILQKIEEEMTRALKEKHEAELLILRLLKTGLKNAEIAKRPQKLSMDDEIRVLKNEAKKHEDSIEMFGRGNRQDLVVKERAELEVIRKYLPKEIGDDELRAVIHGAVEKIGAKTQEDFGKAMKEAMKEVAGRADGKRVGAMVKEFLASLAS